MTSCKPGSFFQRPREAEKRDPGDEVVSFAGHLSPGGRGRGGAG